jgi:hypothetical protein
VLKAKGDHPAFEEEVKIGCPHCQAAGKGFNCDSCPWGELNEGLTFGCLDQSFGGVFGNDVVVHCDRQVTLRLDRDTAWIEWALPSASWFKLSEFCRDGKEVQTFLLGHIEWAEAVISGGIKSWKTLLEPKR